MAEVEQEKISLRDRLAKALWETDRVSLGMVHAEWSEIWNTEAGEDYYRLADTAHDVLVPSPRKIAEDVTALIEGPR